MSEGLDVGTLSGRIELEDHFTPVLERTEAATQHFEGSWKQTGASVVEGAAAFFTAEAALHAVESAAHLAAETLKEITIEGSHAADIEQAFEHLTQGAGLFGDELLGDVREGVRGTITDLDLMTRVNQNLAAGMNLTAAQSETLAKGAFALAKATGGDTAAAFDKLSDAMVTGRVRGIQLLTGKIDLAAAEEHYAEKLGISKDRLTEEQKIEGLREAILDKVSKATDRLGETQTRLADKVVQANVEYKNFMEELGTSIGTSPVVEAAFDTIKNAIFGAFGSDEDTAIRTITADVENLASGAATLATGIVGGFVQARQILSDYGGVIEGITIALGAYYTATELAEYATTAYKLVLADTKLLMIEVTASTAVAQAGLIGAAAALGGFIGYKIGQLQPISDFFEGLALRVEGYSSAEVSAMMETQHATDAAVKAYDPLKAAQEAAKHAAEEHAAEAKAAAAAAAQEAVQAKAAAAAEMEHDEKMRLSKKELDAYIESWANLATMGDNYEDTLAAVDPKILDQVKYYASLGASVKDLTAAFPDLSNAQAASAQVGAKAALTLTEAWNGMFTSFAKGHGDSINEYILGEQRALNVTLEKLRIDHQLTAEAEAQKRAEFAQTVELEIYGREQSDQNSKAYYQHQMEMAQADYDLKMADVTSFTAADIQASAERLRDAREHFAHWADYSNKALEGAKSGMKQFADVATEALDSINAMWDRGGLLVDDQVRKVHTLADEYITAAEAKKRLESGYSSDITYQNFNKALDTTITGYTLTGQVERGLQGHERDAMALAKDGYSFEQIMWMIMNPGSPKPPNPGPRIPGFREGGVGDFGEGTLAMLHGKEAIIPLGGQVPGGGDTNVTIFVNGTAADVARKVSDEIMKTLKQRRQFGAA